MRLKILLIVLLAPLFHGYAQTLKNLSSVDFNTKVQSGNGILLDVRTPQEYSRGHIENSTLISTNDPKFVQKVSLLQKDKPVYVYCLTGSRSYAVANYLSQNGFAEVYNLQHGIMDWQRAGFPIVQSESTVRSTSKTYSISEFNTLLKNNNLVLADFHAVWCAPCKKMAPVIETIEDEFVNKITVSKIDIESNKALQTAYDVQSVPGLILFKNGKKVWTHTGVISEEELSKIIQTYL